MVAQPGSPINRALLAAVFRDQRTLIQVEALLNAAATGLPAAVNAVQVEAKAAQASADGAQATADTGVTNAATAQAAADAAQADADALKLPEYVVAAPSGALAGERVLTGDAGLTVDLTTPGVLQLLLNVITALGYTPANLAGATFTGEVDLSGGVRLGAFTGSADAPVNGYVTVLDSAGNPVKLATIA